MRKAFGGCFLASHQLPTAVLVGGSRQESAVEKTDKEASMFKKTVGTLTLASLSALPILMHTDTAEASLVQSYVCSVTYYPRSTDTTRGSYGSVVLSLSASGEACNMATSHYFCSTGATSASCDTGYLYNNEQLLALYAALREPLYNRSQVKVSTTYLGYGYSYKGAYVIFFP